MASFAVLFPFLTLIIALTKQVEPLPIVAQNPIQQHPGAEVYHEERFTHWQLVGRGAFGIVYKARDSQRNNTVVAIKSYTAWSEAKWLQLAGRGGFTRVPRYYGNFISNTRSARYSYHVVMEYLEGETLDNYVQRRGHLIRKELVASIIYQLSYAIHTFHRSGFAHSDLHAGNVMVFHGGREGGDRNLLVKIVDFGLAKDTIWDHNAITRQDACSVGRLFAYMLTGDWWKPVSTQSDAAMNALLAHINEVCTWHWNWMNQGRRSLSARDILNSAFVQSGRLLAMEWPFNA